MEQGSTPHADAAPTLWYYAEGETIHGPFDEASIVELIQNRALSRETWILREGTQKWVALSDTQFAAYLPVSAPPLSESQNAEPPSAIYSHFNKWMAHLRFKRLAILLAMFFGWIGAHSFYLGFWVRANIQILLTFLVPGGFLIGIFWGIIDAGLIAKGRIAFAAKGAPISIGSLKIENWLDNLSSRLWRIAFPVLVAGLLLLCVTLFAYHEKRVADEAAADARFNQSLREIGARVARNNQAEEESRRRDAEWQQRTKLREDIRAATEPAYGSTEWILRNDQQGRYRDANGNWRTRGDGGPGWRQ